MVLLKIIRKIKQQEKDVRILMLFVFMDLFTLVDWIMLERLQLLRNFVEMTSMKLPLH